MKQTEQNKQTKPIFNHDEESVLKAIGSKLTQKEFNDYDYNAFKKLSSSPVTSKYLEYIYNLDLSTIEKIYITHTLGRFSRSSSDAEEEVKC